MNTPVYDFVEKYIAARGVRAHMPGHKGIGPLRIEERDITEIAGADVLSESEGILGESQKNAGTLFGTGATLYSTEGSSLAVKAMLYAVVMYWKRLPQNRGKRPYILAARNVHRAMLDGCALLDLDVEFIRNGAAQGLCSAVVEPEDVRKALEKCEYLPAAVYITSPDYLGVLSDVAGIAAVCHEKGTLLAVDNAHGAYLAFLEESLHPIYLGADICCDSAHKTLIVLTGGAYLHISRNMAEALQDYAGKGLAMFGSTSPSYLILQSLDLCNDYLDRRIRTELAHSIEQVQRFRRITDLAGIYVRESEPLKIVIDTGASGYDGRVIAEEMRAGGENVNGATRKSIECEFADCNTVVLMVGMMTSPIDWENMRLWVRETRLRHRRKPLKPAMSVGQTPAVRRMSIREAVFADSEMIPVKKSVGRILAQETVSCPPAIPIAVSGEEITGEMVDIFLYYGIDQIAVVKSCHI